MMINAKDGGPMEVLVFTINSFQVSRINRAKSLYRIHTKTKSAVDYSRFISNDIAVE